jgi:hypothetical protein
MVSRACSTSAGVAPDFMTTSIDRFSTLACASG